MGIALIQKKSHQETTTSTEKDLAKSFTKARESLREEMIQLKQTESNLIQESLDEKNLKPLEQMETSKTKTELDPQGNVLFSSSAETAQNNMPEPPAFLMSAAIHHTPSYSRNISPAPTLFSTFHVDSDFEEDQRNRTQFKNAIMITLAAAAFCAGIYFFVKAQKSMSEHQVQFEKILSKVSQNQSPSVQNLLTSPAIRPQQEDKLDLQSSSAIGSHKIKEQNATITTTQRPKPRPMPEIPPSKPIVSESLYTARVIVPHAILRSEPKKESTAIDLAARDEILKIQKQSGNWVRVENSKSISGWVRADLIKF